jgi:hypothetical protein
MPYTQTENLLHSLDELSQDPRLAKVFSKEPSDCCALYLWLLEIKQDKKDSEYRLLYSWVVPSLLRELNRWFSSNTLDKKKFRIHRLVFYHSGNMIFQFVKQLCEGAKLSEACTRAGIAQPTKEAFHQFCLAASQKEIAEFYVARPVVFLEDRLSTENIVAHHKPPISPNETVAAFVGSLYRCDKLNLFSQVDDELSRKCLLHLKEETGLDFCNADSERLGNLEWLCFPASDEYENSQVVIQSNFPNSIEIEILSGVLPIGTSILVNCRSKNGEVIVLDQCKTAQIQEDGTKLDFTAKEQISSVTITIWVQSTSSEAWEIWYQRSTATHIEIQLNVGRLGSTVDFPSEWLQEFANSKKISHRVKSAQTFTPVSPQRQIINERKDEPWVTASEQIRRFTQKLFLPKSGGHFFQKGWVNSELDPGRLSFFEWLQFLTSDTDAGKVLIVDPYFDCSGIVELIARATATQAEYVVLTNTQVKSEDDSLKDENVSFNEEVGIEEPQRAKRLRAICQQLKVRLSNFRLLDLRSKGKGKKQLFHDRYILVFHPSGEVKTGFHLSNSIQGATVSSPLLITPIPQDVLPAVYNYVQSLETPSSDEPFEVVTIFSSEREARTLTASQFPSGIAAIPHANFFFATLLQDENLVSLSEIELGDYLQNHGLFNKERNEFEIADGEYKQLHSCLCNFTRELVATDSADFAKLWTGLGEWLARTLDHTEFLQVISSSGEETLAAQLESFLSKAPDELYSSITAREYEVGDHIEVNWFADLIQLDFPEALQKSQQLLWHPLQGSGYSSFIKSYSVEYAVEALAQLEPNKLTKVILQLKQTLAVESSTDTKNIQSFDTQFIQLLSYKHTLRLIIEKILEYLVSARLEQTEENSFLLALFDSDIPLLRAIVAYNLSPLHNSQPNLQESFSALENLCEIERIYALAEWVFGIRVRANQKSMEDEELRELRLAIFNQIYQNCPSDLSQEQLRSVARRLSGPSEGSWAVSTTNDLLVLLINNGKLQIDQVTNLWLSILVDQIEAEGSAINSGTVDWELTHACAWAIIHASTECRIIWIEKLEKLQGNNRRTLYHPFLRSHNSHKWVNAGVSLLWLESLGNLIFQLNEINEILDDSGTIERLKTFAEKIDDTLAITYILKSWETHKPLFEYASSLREKQSQRSMNNLSS